MVDKVEAMRSGIGLLTLLHGANREALASGNLDEQGIRNARALLWKDVLDFSMSLENVPAECQEVVRRAGGEVATELNERVDFLVIGLLSGFMAVVEAYERDYPDANVAGILQGASLNLTAEPPSSDPYPRVVA